MSLCKNKSAFTLAEILITLGIVGIVAAMVFPTLIFSYQKQKYVNLLRKAYSTLNQAVKLSQANNYEYMHWDDVSDIGAQEYFEKYWKPYLKILKRCDSYSACGYSSNKPWRGPNGNLDFTFSNDATKAAFVLEDGTIVLIVASDGGQKMEEIWVDVNGAMGPNNTSKDFFRFERSKKGLVLPLHSEQSSDYIDEHCLNGDGGACAAKIVKDGWLVQNNYPWKN